MLVLLPEKYIGGLFIEATTWCCQKPLTSVNTYHGNLYCRGGEQHVVCLYDLNANDRNPGALIDVYRKSQKSVFSAQIQHFSKYEFWEAQLLGCSQAIPWSIGFRDI